jgi:hypothetical protein
MLLGCEGILACSWEQRIVRVWQRSSPLGTARKSTSGGLRWCC